MNRGLIYEQYSVCQEWKHTKRSLDIGAHQSPSKAGEVRVSAVFQTENQAAPSTIHHFLEEVTMPGGGRNHRNLILGNIMKELRCNDQFTHQTFQN